MTEPTLEFLGSQIERVLQEVASMRDDHRAITQRLDRIEARVNGLPLIGEAVATLQRDSRLLRAAINDIGRTNITAGEVEALHEDIDRALTELRELGARVATLEAKD